MIFKLQWPLISTDPNVGILCYNETRSIMGEVPKTPQLYKLFERGTLPKIYVIGECDEQGVIHVKHRTADQPW